MSPKTKDKLVNPTNILLGILITVVTTFFSYIVTDIRDLKSEISTMRQCVQTELVNTKEIIVTHLAWHSGKKEIKKD
jgi:hypothetical protein